MTIKELKSEIQKSLDNVPESILQDVLTFLKHMENKSPDQVRLMKNLRDILAEDKTLLERLAKW
jgi:predicted glycosyltransferase